MSYRSSSYSNWISVRILEQVVGSLISVCLLDQDVPLVRFLWVV